MIIRGENSFERMQFIILSNFPGLTLLFLKHLFSLRKMKTEAKSLQLPDLRTHKQHVHRCLSISQ